MDLELHKPMRREDNLSPINTEILWKWHCWIFAVLSLLLRFSPEMCVQWLNTSYPGCWLDQYWLMRWCTHGFELKVLPYSVTHYYARCHSHINTKKMFCRFQHFFHTNKSPNENCVFSQTFIPFRERNWKQFHTKHLTFVILVMSSFWIPGRRVLHYKYKISNVTMLFCHFICWKCWHDSHLFEKDTEP